MSFHWRLRPTNPAAVDTLDVAIEPNFDFGSREYELLQARSRTTAFQAARWLDILHRKVAPALATETFTVIVRDKISGRPVLVVPLVRRRRRGITLLEFADFGVCDYLAAVYDAEDRARLETEVTLPARVAALLPRSDVVSLTKLTGNDPVLARLFPNGRRAPMRVSSYAVRIDATWEEWRAGKLNPSLRHELDVKRRRLAKTGRPTFTLVRGENEIVRAFDALRAFRAHRFEKRRTSDVIDNEVVFSFYRQIAIDGMSTGTARTYALHLSGEPVAVMFGLVHRRVFSLLLVGFDLARYRRLSVGLLAIEDTLRASFEGGDEVYDFTIGDYSFKLQFGARPAPLYEWHVPRTVRGRLAILCIEILREAKRILKPLVLDAQRSLLVATVLRQLNRCRNLFAS